MNDIRILMIVPNLRVSNGVASFAMNYYRQLKVDIHMDFALISDVESEYYEEIKENNDSIYILPPLNSKLLDHYLECEKIIKNGKYEIVHDCVPLKSLIIMMQAKKNGVPVRILHSHNSKLGETKTKELRNAMLMPLLVAQATHFMACSKEAATGLFGGKKYEFIPNVIDGKLYKYDASIRKEIRESIGVGNKKVIGTVGRLAEQKNPFFALDIFDQLAEMDSQIEYWWIGSGPLDQKISDYAKKLKHCNQVKLFGSRNDIRNLYQAIDVFFLPSLFEGLPITGVEAQAMGLPSVVSDTITKEMVFTDLVEYVSLSAPIEEWVKVIERQIQRIPLRRSYTTELENSIFSFENAGQRLKTIYFKMLDEVRK